MQFIAVEFAHRNWLRHREQSTEEKRKLGSGITDARTLARQWRGELTSIDNSPGFLKFRGMTPLGRSYDVTYSIAASDATINTTTISFLTTLVWIHIPHGIGPSSQRSFPWAC